MNLVKVHLVSILEIRSIGVLYKALDVIHGREVALKVEKKDKSRRILENEYDFLRRLQRNYCP